MYLRLNGLLPPSAQKKPDRNEEVTVERPAGVIAVAIAFLSGRGVPAGRGTDHAGPARPDFDGRRRTVAGRTRTRGPLHVSSRGGGRRCQLPSGSGGSTGGPAGLAILVTMIGVVLLLPGVSAAILDFRIGQTGLGRAGNDVRVLIVWYLFQEPVREAFVRVYLSARAGSLRQLLEQIVSRAGGICVNSRAKSSRLCASPISTAQVRRAACMDSVSFDSWLGQTSVAARRPPCTGESYSSSSFTSPRAAFAFSTILSCSMPGTAS